MSGESLQAAQHHAGSGNTERSTQWVLVASLLKGARNERQVAVTG